MRDIIVVVVVWIYVTRRDLSMVKRQILRFAVCLLENRDVCRDFMGFINGSNAGRFLFCHVLQAEKQNESVELNNCTILFIFTSHVYFIFCTAITNNLHPFTMHMKVDFPRTPDIMFGSKCYIYSQSIKL